MARDTSATNASSTIPRRDPRLVGDDDHGEAGPVEQPDRIDRERKERQALEPLEIPGLFDDRAVPIEEHRRAS